MEFNSDGSLKSQDELYLNEDRFDDPKEVHKRMADMVGETPAVENGVFLDVGCATGEFLFYLTRRFPGIGKFAGTDISAAMTDKAREMMPAGDFFVSDLSQSDAYVDRREFDAVTCSGVMPMFDDLDIPFRNLLSLVRRGGTLIVFMMCNDHPIDVIMRYRRADTAEREWEKGWNCFSRHSVIKTLEALPYKLRIEDEPFEMPFAIAHRPEDPMRTWTMRTENKPFQTVNGANQMVDTRFFRITVEDIYEH